jgi:preprotein translocase SecE subunit
MARNRQRNRPGRPQGGERPDAPTPSGGGLVPPPPISEDPVTVFADDDDDGRGETGAFGLPAGASGGGGAADAAFGREESDAEQRRPAGNIFARTFGFLGNCWSELQRVQWPDRQQVAQATGVVLGFVVVTGIFLGIADFVAGKLVNWIV